MKNLWSTSIIILYINNYPGPHSMYYKTFLKNLVQELRKGRHGPSRYLIDRYLKQQPLHPDFKENNIVKIVKRRVMVDKTGRIETFYTPLEIGNDEFGLIHFLIGHWKNQFQRWQMDVFELVDTIMNTINNKVGRLTSDGAIIYEMGFSDIYGKEQYLAVIFGDYNNIITAWRISEYEDADKLFTTTNFIGEV